MCMSTVLAIKKVDGAKAIMADGRIVLLGSIHDAVAGEMLRVYANVAIEKVLVGKKGIPS
jgi:hypothetical protein